EVAKLAAERGKPIVLIKIGRSELGARAARSHTAALTGADARYDAIFAQYGVIRVQDYDELLEIAHLLAHTPKPQVPGIAVVSHSGGISSLTADMCGQAGLDLPPLGEKARAGINGILKGFGWAANPADVTGFANSESFPPITHGASVAWPMALPQPHRARRRRMRPSPRRWASAARHSRSPRASSCWPPGAWRARASAGQTPQRKPWRPQSSSGFRWFSNSI